MCCIFSEHLFLKHLWRAAFCHDFLTYNDFRLILGHLKNPFRQIVLALELKSKVYHAKKMSIPLQISLINVNKSTFSADLFTNTKEILNGKLHFCAVLRANKIRLFISVQRSSPPDLFLGKSFLKICSNFTEEDACRSAILKSHFSMRAAL